MPMRGQKWLNGATYLSDADRQLVADAVAECKRAFPEFANTVGVRCPAYIGEPHPIASVTYGPGGCSLYRSVYRPSVTLEHTNPQGARFTASEPDTVAILARAACI